MAFTYGGDPSASNLAKVRFLLSDTNSADYELEDAEITYLLTEWGGDVYDAASAGAEVIAGKFAKAATSKSVGDLSLSFQNRAEDYRMLASRLKQLKTDKFVPTPWISSQSILAASISASIDVILQLRAGSGVGVARVAKEAAIGFIFRCALDAPVSCSAV